MINYYQFLKLDAVIGQDLQKTYNYESGIKLGPKGIRTEGVIFK